MGYSQYYPWSGPMKDRHRAFVRITLGPLPMSWYGIRVLWVYHCTCGELTLQALTPAEFVRLARPFHGSYLVRSPRIAAKHHALILKTHLLSALAMMQLKSSLTPTLMPTTELFTMLRFSQLYTSWQTPRRPFEQTLLHARTTQTAGATTNGYPHRLVLVHTLQI